VVAFDASVIKGFFYDSLCCAHQSESCSTSGAPHCCPDYSCLPDDPMRPDASHSCQVQCVADGGVCRPGTAVGCCGGLFCGAGGTCRSCVGIGEQCHFTDGDVPCCGGASCNPASNLCCLDRGRQCASHEECCSGLCNATGICDVLIE
jgi:hypothetical protein